MADAGRSGPLSGPGSIAAVRRIQSERQREQRQNQSENEEDESAGDAASGSGNSGDPSYAKATDEAAALEGPSPGAIDVSDDPSIAAEEGLPGDSIPGKKGQFIDERC